LFWWDRLFRRMPLSIIVAIIGIIITAKLRLEWG
jgi:hypothetical protein